MRAYKVRKDLKKYVRRNLKKNYYSCRMFKDEQGTTWCQTNAPSDTFHKIIYDSIANKMSDESGIVFIPKSMVNHASLIRNLNAFAVDSILDCYI